MGQAARVTEVEAILDWKGALCVFKDAANEALTSIEMEIRRMFDWLEDQGKFWHSEVRRREDLVVQAKAELWRRKVMPVIGKHPDTSEQEKNLRKAQARLEEAEEKKKLSHKWVIALKRAVDEYEGQGRHLGGMLDADVPKALAMLERKLAALEAYQNLAPVRPAESPAPAATNPPGPPSANKSPGT